MPVDLWWLPLGAGARCVRSSGLVFEALCAAAARRRPQPLFHAALVVDGHVIELAPVVDADGASRGAVLEGPVGLGVLGRWRLFRYELRCWRGGVLDDAAYGTSQRLSDDPAAARRVLEAVPDVPVRTWARWNSNSVIAWLLARSGIDAAPLHPPGRGRAPGWVLGVTAASRGAQSGKTGLTATRRAAQAAATASGSSGSCTSATGRR